MASNIKVGLEVNDSGKLKDLVKQAKALKDELTAVQKAIKSMGNGVASGSTRPTKEENVAYRNARGVAGTGSGATRDFAKQAQGLGGLVHLYATFAANIFAVSAAFMALDKAAQFTQMIEGAKALEATTGAALRSIADNMKDVTDGALSMQESLRLTSLGSAAGLSSKRILELTKGAKGASLALGRDMADSIDRVIRGVAKLEPELLDELGVVTRAQEAYNKYAKSIGISADELTSYQKTVAYSTAVAEELNRKFGAIADKVPANPYAKFLGELKDVGTDLLNVVNTVVTPAVTAITNNVELMVAAILLVVKNLTTRAIPEIGKIFLPSPDAIAKQEAHLKELTKQREMYFASQKKEAVLAKEALLATKKEEMAALVKLEQEGLAKLQQYVKTNYKKTNSAGAAAILGATNMADLQKDQTAKKSLAAKEMSARRALAKAELEDSAASNALTQEKVRLAKADVGMAEEANRLLGVQIVESKQLLEIKAQMLKIEAQQLITQNDQVKKTALQTEYLRTRAIVAKQERASQLAYAEYAFGKDSEQYRKIDLRTEKRVAATTRSALRDNPLFAGNAPGEKLNALGKAAFGAKMAFNGLSEALATAGKGLGKVIGFLGTWGTVAVIAFDVFSWGADKLGLLNKKTDELNAAIKEGNTVLQTATSVYTEYTYAVMDAESSLAGIIARNSISVSTLEQVTDSITKQVSALRDWQSESGILSKIWDNVGTSKFEAVRDQVAEELEALAKVSQGQAKEDALLAASKTRALREEKDGTVGLLIVNQELAALKERESNRLNNESSKIKDIETAASNAAEALRKLQDKEFIKDDKRRTIVEYLKIVEKEISDTEASFEKQISILATIPEEFIGETDSKLSKIRETAQAIQAIVETNNDLLKKAQQAEDKLLGDFKDIPKTALSELIDTEDIQDRLLKIAVEKAQIENKLTNDNISEEERKRLEADRRVSELKQKFMLSGIRDELITRKEAVDAYLAYEEAQKEKLRVSALSWTEAFGEGIFTAIKKAIDKALSFLPAWMRGDTPPPKPIATEEDPRAAGMKVINESGVLAKLQTDLKEQEAAKKLKDEIAKQTEKGNATKGSDRRSKALALEKEELKAQLEYLQAMSKYIIAFANDDERRLGYTTLTTLEAQKQNILAQISVRAKQQEVDIEDKYRKSKPEIGVAKANALRDKALASLRLEVATERAVAENAQLVAEEKSKNLQYQQEILRPLENQLQLEQGILDAKKSLGLVNPVSEIRARFELERQAALNALNAATQGISADTVAVKNAKDKYNLTMKELSLKEKVALKLQEIADEQERNNLALNISNMYLEDMTSRMDRFANAGINSAKIQEQITTEFENQIKQIKLKNNPATEALEIEKATLEYINKQSDAYDKLHEARKRQLSEKGQTDDGTSARQVIYDEARRLEDEFRRSLPDYITFVFSEIYAGMDAAIDSFVEKLFTGQKIYFKDLISTFDQIVREESRKMVADQIKLLARSLITKVFGGEGVKTKEERLEEYQETAAKAAKKALEYHSAIFDLLENIDYNIAEANDLQAANVQKPSSFEEGGKDKNDTETKLGKMFDMFGDKIKDILGGIGESIGSIFSSGAGSFLGTDGVPEAGLTAAEYLPGLLGESKSFFSSLTESFGSLTGSMSEGLTGVLGGEGVWGSLIDGMGTGLSSLIPQIQSMFSSSSSGGGMFESITGMFDGFDMSSLWPFAAGGIMSEYGPLKLNKYASGGIANTPQVAIFGEGSKPEAYVPLPDGRNIPVKMQEGNNQKAQQQQVVNVTNNFTIQGNASRETQNEIARKVGISINRSIQRNG